MNNKKICVIAFPMPSNNVVNTLLVNLADLLQKNSSQLIIIGGMLPEQIKSGKNLKTVDIGLAMCRRELIGSKILSALVQLKLIFIIQCLMLRALSRISPQADLIIFFKGGVNLIPAIILSKIFKKKVAFFAAGLQSGGLDSRFQLKLFTVLEKLIFILADIILVESQNAIGFFKLDKYKDKIICDFTQYVDSELFTKSNPIKERQPVVGYVGRLQAQKGVKNFLDAVNIISQKRKDIKFMIGGSGPLYQQLIKESSSNNQITFSGWISHDDQLPAYLNDLKLLVLPSGSEGLPTIILEAMACGTPVLATAVGCIPDILIDGETGFILADNRPETIALNIERVIDSADLEYVSENARRLSISRFSFNEVVKKYKEILSSYE